MASKYLVSVGKMVRAFEGGPATARIKKSKRAKHRHESVQIVEYNNNVRALREQIHRIRTKQQ